MRRFALLSVFPVFLLVGACVTTDPSEGPRRDRNLIGAEELATLSSGTVYQAVQQLRPAWLRSRGPSSSRSANMNYPAVFLDGVPIGDIETLKTHRTDGVVELRFIPARDATTRFGTGYTAGIIAIYTR